MRLALGFGLACAAVFAQAPEFRHLATTDDGSRLYFSSTWGSPFARIFVYGPSGLHVFAQQDTQALKWPSASGDAAVVAFSGDSQASLALTNGNVFWTGIGRAAISRNGGFALFASEAGATVLNLRDYSRFSVALDPAAWTGIDIASDGTAAIPGSTSIQIVRQSGVSLYPTQGIPNSAAIDDQGATVAYEAQGR